MEAVRIEIVPIRFLRRHGYESADETISASHYQSAVLVGTNGNIVGATIGRPLLRLGRKSSTVTPQ